MSSRYGQMLASDYTGHVFKPSGAEVSPLEVVRDRELFEDVEIHAGSEPDRKYAVTWKGAEARLVPHDTEVDIVTKIGEIDVKKDLKLSEDYLRSAHMNVDIF
ncbi:hypothetical protein SH580_06935 [Coraliomargarita algicola]|uniref:Uncharacterized protein n=1 Tax=Coraliomargarita algicola TaxID=3092156 RepID=A0ABZ0RWR0_9BACT|nr:hypothetical protein [Coraliomargarita sp. J2-16]WPJ97444.1 hypothetical protein SH580_06935 [Coraliomargarita sp. J2-16]